MASETTEAPTRAGRVEAIRVLTEELGRKPLQREIAEKLGVSRSYAASLVNDPDGSRDRERKQRYAGECEKCGGPTCGGDGRAKAPKTCLSCLRVNPPGLGKPGVSRPRWNREKCEEALVDWVWREKRIPRVVDLIYADPAQPRPCMQTFMRWCYEYEDRVDSWQDWRSGKRRTRTVQVVSRGLPQVLADLAPRLPIEAIIAASNATTRAVLFEAVGVERLVLEHGRCIAHDEVGTLWELAHESFREPVVMVGVVNSTPEPDGSFRDYFLRVPPTMTTPREAVAWTFGIADEEEYVLDVQT